MNQHLIQATCPCCGFTWGIPEKKPNNRKYFICYRYKEELTKEFVTEYLNTAEPMMYNTYAEAAQALVNGAYNKNHIVNICSVDAEDNILINLRRDHK